MPSVRAAMTARVVMMLFLFQDCCVLQMTKDVMAVGTDDSTLSSLSVEIGQAGDITANSRTIHRMGMNGEASHGTNNLCMFGKLVPEVMIIGVQKAELRLFTADWPATPASTSQAMGGKSITSLPNLFHFSWLKKNMCMTT